MPSHHSSSSHSSSSHSSSSHSSSSRSFSSHGPSSHSSSSHSSSSRSFSYRSGPSTRSSSSHSSTGFGGVSRYVAGGSMQGRVIQRPRRNQPAGYVPKEHSYRSPTTHMCLKHNYVYYPSDWTDSSSGRSYRKGYYDENGAYYENVIFKQNGQYSKVPCCCDYCGVTTAVTLETEGAIVCPQCGAPLRITALLDEYTQDPVYTLRNRPLTTGQKVGRFFLKPWVIILLVFLTLGFIGAIEERIAQSRPSFDQIWIDPAPVQVLDAAPSNVELFGETLYLDAAGDGAYRLSDDGSASFDKSLDWIEEDGGYYDPDSECWLWFNNDVDPGLWQYWYDGVSSDFGDCGWMEYEPEGWFIERSPGDWIALPDRYDSAALWHLEGDLAELP